MRVYRILRKAITPATSTRRAIIRVRVFSAKQLTGNPDCRREVLPSLLAGTRVRFEGWIGMLSDLLDREEFFKKQTEECRDLARNAVNADDRAFWELAAKRWNEQLLAVKRANRPKRQTRRVAGNGTSEAKSRRVELRQAGLRASPSTEMPRSSSFFLQIGALARRLVSAF